MVARSAPGHAPPGRASQYGVVDECSTLNVDGTTAWTCHDAEYPIVRIEHNELAGWSYEIRPISAVAVGGTGAALFDVFPLPITGDLTSGRFRPKAEFRVVLPNGSPVPSHAEIVSRGGTLHIITDVDWYQRSLCHLTSDE